MTPHSLNELVTIGTSLLGTNPPMRMLLLKATLILVAALLVTIAMRRTSAGARHLVLYVALGTVLLVPLLSAWTPLRLEILPARSVASVQSVDPAARVAAAARDADATPRITTAPTATGQPQYQSPTVENPTLLERLAGTLGVTTLLAVWGIVALGIMGWLVYGAFSVRRIVRNAYPLDGPQWRTPLFEVADRLELAEPPRLLASEEIRMPFACGFLKPTIVFPADCERWSLDRRHAVLLHELAHVKRRDLVGHTLGRIACALYWFHPLAWAVAKRLRAESERACDDLALSCGARPSDYAEHLLDIVTSVRHDATPAVALAMARRREFEGRMLAILDPELHRIGPSRRQATALVSALGLMAIFIGAASPVARTADLSQRDTQSRDTLFAVERPLAPENEPDPAEPDDPARPDRERSVPMPFAEPLPQGSLPTGRGLQGQYGGQVGVGVDVRGDARAEARARADADVEVDAETDDAIAKLRNVPDDERPQLLAKILASDTSVKLRRIAAWGLREFAERPVAVTALATALRRDADAGVREMAAWSLGQGDEDATAVKALGEALRSDADVEVRATAAWAIGHIGDRDGVDALVAALADASVEVRRRAAWGIGHVGPQRAPAQLVALLKDSDPKMRELAAWALYQIEDPSSASALEAALRVEKDKDLQIAYIRALASMEEGSVDALRGLLTSQDEEIRTMVVRALAGGSAAGPWPWPWPQPRPFP